ncbi:thioredoxin-related transmembrane protein 4-like [Drosophila navojoa]|uniref:thioredoxin-related transmembrane protein 4-like n=1 Tax=Drosophila navojoa TaxID=7232 RepID=UPI000847542E|nr:thioredoxin-related transmembrane protein 4-like [Drosophila navojoa]
MEIWPNTLCLAALLVACGVAGELQHCVWSENPRNEKFILDESSWELTLEGEWMIGFCVPLIMACIKFERVWSKFAHEKQLEQSDMTVASMKLEYSETVIRRFSLHELPTILHVKNGVFRKLPTGQSIQELHELASFKWQEIDPMPFWQHPNGLLIRAHVRYIQAIDQVYRASWFNADYEHATWLVRIGLILIMGIILTIFCNIYNCLYDRPKPPKCGKKSKKQVEGHSVRKQKGSSSQKIALG